MSSKNKKNQVRQKSFISYTIAALLFLGFGYVIGKGPQQAYTSIRESLDSDYNRYYFYLHIPKTGGTTITRTFLQQLPQGMFLHEDHENFLRPSHHINYKYGHRCFDTKRHTANYVFGHIIYGTHCDIKNYEYFTTLRDPVERVFSYFRYFVSRPVMKSNSNLDYRALFISFLNNKDISKDNAQVRRISGIGGTIPYGKVTRKHLEIAKNNLRKDFTVIGTLEDFDKFKLMIFNRTGIEIPTNAHHNEFKKSEIDISFLTKNDRKRIADMNKYDSELYEFAKKLSNQQFEKMPEEIKQKYRSIVIYKNKKIKQP